MSRPRYAVFAVALVGAVSGCGSNTAAPSAPAPKLALHQGEQWLSIAGLSFPGGDVPPCTPPAISSGLYVTTLVTVSWDGGEWIARSAPSAAASIQMRFREVDRNIAQTDVRGTISGSAADMARPPLTVTALDSRIVLGPGVEVRGDGDRYASYAGGTLSGAIRFADSKGNVANCDGVIWALFPATPGAAP